MLSTDPVLQKVEEAEPTVEVHFETGLGYLY
jgi:hypothetical protein